MASSLHALASASAPHAAGAVAGGGDVARLSCAGGPVRVEFGYGRGMAAAAERGCVQCCAAGEAGESAGAAWSGKDPYAVPAEWREWEARRKAEVAAASEGITIRRRPPTGPPKHYVGPFEFRVENEGNTPRNVLEEIVWHKDVEVTQMKEKLPLGTVKKLVDAAGPTRDFIGALRKRAEETGQPALIAEVKKASPSRGVIQPDFDPVRIAKAYEQGGAACLSVLTDSKFFQGSFENLRLIRDAGVEIPLLCKEFILDAWQLYYARAMGADAALLIAAVLPDQDLKYFTKILSMLGMVALVEVHSAQELDRVLQNPDIKLIGINNRNLETFQVDIKNTVQLLEGERGQIIRDRGLLVVGESGLFTPDDIALVQNAGVGAVLVGESLVKQNDPAAGIAGLFGKDISGRTVRLATVPA